LQPRFSAQHRLALFGRITTTSEQLTQYYLEKRVMNNPKSRSRWSMIAEDLGLASEPEPVAATPPPVVEEPAKPAPVAAVEAKTPPVEAEAEPPRSRKRRGAVEEPPEEPAAPEAPVEAAVPDTAPIVEEAVEVPPAEVAPSESPAEQRKRGRRRGRRGRGRRGEPAEAAPTEAADEESAAAESVKAVPTDVTSEGGEPTVAMEMPKVKERRGRGRKSKRATKGGEETPKETTIAETIVPEPKDEDDGEAEDVSGWEVPSWNELIAGLYRPER
jgi:hypothetical protein